MVARRVLLGEAIAELRKYRDGVTSRLDWYQYVEVAHHARRRIGIGSVEQREAAFEQGRRNSTMIERADEFDRLPPQRAVAISIQAV